MLAVVALVGQPAFAFIKRRVPRQDTPPAEVGVTRYRIGVVLVLAWRILVSWLEPLRVAPLSGDSPRDASWSAALADALVLVGLFVLGGGFLGQAACPVRP